MFEFLSKYGSPGIQERLGKLLNKDDAGLADHGAPLPLDGARGREQC
jgi:hypothetical protein